MCVSFYKGSIGQQFITIRVENQKKNGIHFSIAILRILLKHTQGRISLWTISSSPKKQAIHDAVVKSIVLKNELLQTIRHFSCSNSNPSSSNRCGYTCLLLINSSDSDPIIRLPHSTKHLDGKIPIGTASCFLHTFINS
jgi:hypothetical protein